MDAKAAAAIARQLEELKEVNYKAKIAQRKSDIKGVVADHKAAGAKRIVVLDIFLAFPFVFFRSRVGCFCFSYIFWFLGVFYTFCLDRPHDGGNQPAQ